MFLPDFHENWLNRSTTLRNFMKSVEIRIWKPRNTHERTTNYHPTKLAIKIRSVCALNHLNTSRLIQYLSIKINLNFYCRGKFPPKEKHWSNVYATSIKSFLWLPPAASAVKKNQIRTLFNICRTLWNNTPSSSLKCVLFNLK